MVIELLIIAACLVLNGLLAAVEMAFVSLSKPLLRQLARGGDKEAQKILFLREAPERTLSVIQIGITLVASISAAVGGASAFEGLSPILHARFGLTGTLAHVVAMALVVVPLTYFNVLLGELVPKTLALRHPLKIMLIATRWLVAIEKVLNPFVTALEWSTRKVLSLKPLKTEAPEPASSDIVELGGLSTQTKQYVLNLVNIEHKHVCDVLVPWDQVIYVRHNQSMAEVESIVLNSGHTRLPVMLNGAVIGILNTKEFMSLRASGQDNWSTLIRPALRVQESDTLFKAFRAMQEIRSHLSVVYNGIRPIGIITMEDVLEEFIGEIYDEDDDSRLRRILLAGRMKRVRSAR
ncbi:MAG: hemolysin family protein [Bdellovibrionia bacterium]